MVLKHLIIIHLIYRIAGCNDHIWLMASLKEFQILVDRICRSSVPVSVICRDRRSEHIQAALLSSKIPPFGGIQMFIQ